MRADGLRRGIAFPPHLDASGRWAWSGGIESIRESIHIILSTSPGERVALPTFGAGLRTFLYDPNTATTRRLIQESILRALGRWEPRIAVHEVVVEADPKDPEVAQVLIRFEVVATGATEQVNLAFALVPSGDE